MHTAFTHFLPHCVVRLAACIHLYLAKQRVLRGALTITYVKEENMFTTFEQHCIRAEKDEEEDAEFNRSGAYFPRGKDSFLMVSRKLDHYAELQIAYVTGFGKSNAMIGVHFSDWHGSSFYAGRLYGKRLKARCPPTKSILSSPLN